MKEVRAMIRLRRVLAVLALAVVPGVGTSADNAPSAERGRKALLERSFTPASIPIAAYDGAWRVWDPKAPEPPPDYPARFRERYGLHPAPYPNGGYPMGLRAATGLLGKALTNDCLVCHGGSILGQSYVGLGNSTLDFQALYEELAAAAGMPRKPPHVFCNVRGTSEAGAMAVFLLGLREPDLRLHSPRLDLDLHDDLCEDVPAWWLLRKKKTMYHTGGGDARSVRSLMQFMMSPLNGPSAFSREEPTFRDIRAYILSLEAPKYPFPIDAARARAGKQVFETTCSRCHGTYGENWTYPNRIVPIKEIGTDPRRYEGISRKFGDYYNQSWFAHEKGDDGYKGVTTEGYQAPPLDGVWATAPYLHNGSAPTVHDVLDSKARPRVFTRSYRTGEADYDREKLGWKVKVLDGSPDPSLPGIERRKVYDTTQPGRGNGGHTFGDKLSEEQRMAVIEYLKTL
jgi:mono/diheme cytochrome c family protein